MKEAQPPLHYGETRMDGRASVEQVIRRLRSYADSLEAILNCMPEELTEDQERGLYNIVYQPFPRT